MLGCIQPTLAVNNLKIWHQEHNGKVAETTCENELRILSENAAK